MPRLPTLTEPHKQPRQADGRKVGKYYLRTGFENGGKRATETKLCLQVRFVQQSPR